MPPTPHFYPTSFKLSQFTRLFFPSLLVISAAVCATSQAHAQDIDWRFDIEVVIFKRNIDVSTITEQFAHTAPRFASHNAVDLLSDYIQPNLDYLNAGLAVCSQGEEPEPSTAPDSDLHLENTVFQLNKDMALAQAQLTSQKAGGPAPVKADNIDEELTIADQTASIPYTWQPVHWQLPTQLPCVFARDKKLLRGHYDHPVASPMAKRVPVEIDGIEWPERLSPYLLPKDNAALDALVSRIAGQRELSPILHLTWRQPVVFGRSKAVPIKLIAGGNYADEFTQSGWRKPAKLSNTSDLASLAPGQEPNTTAAVAPRDLFREIELALRDTTPIQLDTLDTPEQRAAQEGVSPQQTFVPVAEKPLWQLEGDMKIYLQNVGSTPYLHIDSDLDFRQPIKRAQQTSASETQNDFLQSYNFNQLRRVISTQLHYFDHPLFGMVVQIRRYELPEPAEPKEPDAN
jgi:hypothetical protein